jgi:hypothetical protein
MKHLALLLFCAVTLSSCAMKYGSKADSFFGLYGYSEMQIDTASYVVSFEGDETLDKQVVERYVLFRCAELTVEKGYEHFVVIDKDQDHATRISQGVPMRHTSTEHVHVPGGMQTVAVTTTTRSISIHDRHSASKTIRMFRNTSMDGMPQAYNAKFMLNSMASEVKR